MNKIYNIFTHNWYNRNNENYVYGPAFPVTGYLTDTLYTQAEVVKMFADYKLIEDELKSILFNRFNIKVNIKISDTTEDSYTDGKNIVIKSMKEITNNYDRLDMIFGIAFHEISHCLFTDFKYGKSKHIFSNPLLHHIENILEDEEIENRIVKKHSGYGKFIAKVKYELLGKGCASAENLRKKSKNDLDDIMKILFCVIRYPKNIMNMAIGYLQRVNPILRTFVLDYANKRVKSFINDDTLYCNTDSIVSLTRRFDIEENLGDGLGQWKLEHFGDFAYKGFCYQWNKSIPSYRGVSKSWFKPDFDILVDELPECGNLYFYNQKTNQIERLSNEKDKT